MKTMKQLCEEALWVQDACNLSGVVMGFGRMMNDLCDHIPKEVNRREWLRKHPLMVLWIDKILDMVGRDITLEAYHRAYEFCTTESHRFPLPLLVEPPVGGEEVAC